MPRTLLILSRGTREPSSNRGYEETRMSKGKPPPRRTEMDLQGSEAPVAKLGPDIKAKIGQQLRTMYGEVVNQGVPDRFADILRGLDEPSGEGSKE
jgi:hypothetical protein